ncbi:MAG: hypothetical protein AAF497_25535, partial [Planctomycetota bacterium]
LDSCFPEDVPVTLFSNSQLNAECHFVPSEDEDDWCDLRTIESPMLRPKTTRAIAQEIVKSRPEVDSGSVSGKKAAAIPPPLPITNTFPAMDANGTMS